MTETNATALPCRIKIDIRATTARELMTQLFDIYHLYNNVDGGIERSGRKFNPHIDSRVRLRMVDCLRFLAVLGSVLAVLALCTGCQVRETNKALQQSDQAQEGAQRVLAEKLAPRVVLLPVEIQAEVKAAMDQVCALLASSRTSLRPALALTAGNEPPPTVDTTVEDAVERPQPFITKAAMQAGRASAEVEQIGWWLSVASVAMLWGQSVGGGLLSQLLLVAGGGTGIAALVAKGVQMFRELKTAKAATVDAVAFGNDAARAMTPEELKSVVDAHERRQSINGTKAVIQKAGAVIKRSISSA